MIPRDAGPKASSSVSRVTLPFLSSFRLTETACGGEFLASAEVMIRDVLDGNSLLNPYMLQCD